MKKMKTEIESIYCHVWKKIRDLVQYIQDHPKRKIRKSFEKLLHFGSSILCFMYTF